MIEGLSQNNTEGVRELYKTNPTAAKILDYFANRERSGAVQVNRVQGLFPDLKRSEIIATFRQLESLGFGRFLAGRRSKGSRFLPKVSLRDLGQAAAGADIIVRTVENPIDADDEPATIRHPSISTIRHLFRLRPNFLVQIELPSDLTQKEAERLALNIRALPFES